MARSVGLTSGATVEIITAYAVANASVSASTPSPPWVVIGGFYMPQDAPATLEAVGSVSLAGVSLILRLWDVAASAVVAGSTTEAINGTTDARRLSSSFVLVGGKIYQIQAQCLGASPQTGVVRCAQLI